jgi:hypothetical protein
MVYDQLIEKMPLFCVQIIMLSASANKLSRLKEQAEEYAALIMEELDSEGLGYIEVKYHMFHTVFFMIWLQLMTMIGTMILSDITLSHQYPVIL